MMSMFMMLGTALARAIIAILRPGFLAISLKGLRPLKILNALSNARYLPV